MASTIGIKIANGEFYSIVEENSPVKKRLVLTTVHDNQRSVQIDLYKSYTRTMADALYIGSLVVENIKQRPKGEPSIELVITSEDNGEIVADAVDLDTSVQGEHQTLNVSLKSMDEDNREYEIPDFELEHNETPPSGLYGKAAQARKEGKKKFPWLIVICCILIVVAIAILLWLLLFKDEELFARQAQPVTEEIIFEPYTPPPQRETAPAPLPIEQIVQIPVPVIQAPASTPPAASTTAARNVRSSAPVASYRVPSVIPPEGVPYQIRWGDTLWDIAGAFYRNPWLYPRIARFNNIRNPDRIIAGTTIRVPPRN